MRCFKNTLLLLTTLGGAASYDLDPENPNSIKAVSKQVAAKLMSYYPGNKPGGIPGLFGEPYYWWEAGAVFGALVDYWHYTGDTTYNRLTTTALLHQVGPDINYMPPNQSKSLGNDDQAFWGLAAMAAAERNFPNPPRGQPQWLPLAQAVFNTQVPRWEEETCGGGLRWQIYSFNNGYNYKNTVSNGCFFLLAARLARFTGNATYAEWAEKTWDWTQKVGLVSEQYKFYDGFGVEDGCKTVDPIQWTYNAGLYLAGSAFLYNYTDGSPKWGDRVQGIMQQTSGFFPSGIMYEPACEPWGTCNTDQRSFKAYLSRFMALTVQMAPFTSPFILPRLRSSAIAAAKNCEYGADGETCGMRWTEGKWDGAWGVGEQLSALETIQSNLVALPQKGGGARPPLTKNTGGTSVGNPNAGVAGEVREDGLVPMTKGERDGAKVLTAATVILLLVFDAWVCV